VIGAEALIRWQHPQQGLLMPAEFLPVIETDALAIEVGEWVIDTALAQMAQWLQQGLELPVSVNVGARQLQQADFVSRLQTLLSEHPQVRTANLEIEILETSALEDLARVSQVIEDCSAIGVRFAMDDFGTGYSSLTYLRRLRIHMLKIDQSFVRNMLDNANDLAILQGVIGLANAFRRAVIAEGVETVDHGSLLLQLGCDAAQGYGIARPMPAADLPGWAASWTPDAAWQEQTLIPAQHIPLLYARIEHRAWITAVKNYILGDHQSPPALDAHSCYFGQWLDGEASAHFGQLPGFVRLGHLHAQAHALATRMLALQGAACNAQALALLPELEALREQLLAQFDALAHSHAPQPLDQGSATP